MEEAFNLARVQIDCYHMAYPSTLCKIGQKLAHYCASPALSCVAAGIAEIGGYPGNARRARATAGVRNGKYFHDILIYRRTGRLDDKELALSNRIIQPNVNLGIWKPLNTAPRHFNTERLSNKHREPLIRASAGDNKLGLHLTCPLRIHNILFGCRL